MNKIEEENIKDTKEMGWNLFHSFLELPEMFYSKIKLNPVNSPELIILNKELTKSLGLDIEALKSKEGIDVLAGNKEPEGAIPLAQAYAGHQFGHFTMLGDGRAMLFGEQIYNSNERVDIQLKGSGKTPYSRGGDGRGAIGPMAREYITSEAMFNLSIPTTRSLALVATGEQILRERPLPGAILTRVASSHIRVGTFEYARTWGKVEDIRAIADYSIRRHYPEIEEDDNRYLSLLKEVIKSQAETVAKWELVGFIHGVMNTDNMTISGETIDYGPCAFMDVYDPRTVFSSIDQNARYAYKNQAKIAQWNLARFAEALLPLIHEDENEAIKLAESAMNSFKDIYSGNWLNGMRKKLGIINEEPEDKELIDELLSLMEKYKADYTNTFIALTFNKLNGMDLFNSEEFKSWHKKWKDRLSRERVLEETIQERMKRNNPAVIPRNFLVEEALEAAENKGDYELVYKLIEILSEPYNHSKDYGKYAETPEPTLTPYKTFCGT